MANVGDKLEQPETGWQRIEDNDPTIIYTGSYWTTSSVTPDKWSGKNVHYIATKDGSKALSSTVEFKFYGTKLRLISTMDSNSSNSLYCSIDGVKHEYSLYNISEIYNVLVLDVQDLTGDVHSAKITNNENKRISRKNFIKRC